MASDWEQIVLQAPPGLKAKANEYAANSDVSLAELIRVALAEKVEYDYANEPKPLRTTKYATDEERTSAALKRASLMRWGNATVTKMITRGNIEAAQIVAKAVNDHDYDALDALKSAADASAEVESDLSEERD